MPPDTFIHSLVLVILFALGAIFASFTTVIVERVYTGQSWLSGRSRCNSCRRMLNALDLVPIFSWLATRGKCRTCGSRVPAQYAVSEAVLGTLFAISFIQYGLTLQLGLFLALLVVLFFVVLYDLRHTIVPVFSSALLIALGVAFQLSQTLDLLALGTIAGIAIVIALGFYLLYALSRGRAMGLGDTPVALGLSFAAGAHAIPALVFSFWIGAVIGIGILFLRRGGPQLGIEVPFVPFLAAGFLLAVFTGWNPFVF